MPPNLTSKILDFLNRTEEEYTPKVLALYLSKKYDEDINPASVNTILQRLAKEGKIERPHRGFYKGKSGETGVDIDKLLLNGGEYMHPNPPQIHNLIMVFNPKKIAKWMEYNGISTRTDLERMWREAKQNVRIKTPEKPEEIEDSDTFLKLSNKRKVGLSKSLQEPKIKVKPFPTQEVKVNPFILGDPMKDESFYQRYRFTQKPKDIKGGKMETFEIETNRTLTIEIYGTGSVILNLSTTKNPMNISDLHAFMHGYLDAFFNFKFNYKLKDVSSLFYVTRCEFNYDHETPMSFTSETPYGIKSITVSEIEHWTMQVYEKSLDYGDVVREEYAYSDWETPVASNTFAQTLDSIAKGGMSYTATGMALKDIHELLEEYGNAIKFLLKTSQKQGSEMQKISKLLSKLK